MLKHIIDALVELRLDVFKVGRAVGRRVRALYFGGSAISFVVYPIVGYLFAFSHDGAPLEIDADNSPGDPYEDPFGKGLWPVFAGTPVSQSGSGGSQSGGSEFTGGHITGRSGGAPVFD